MLPSLRIAPRVVSRGFYQPFILTQSFSATTAPKVKISESIKHDHQELRQYYNNIKNAKTSDEKIQWRNQFTWELARHSIGEELVVYPAFERLLPDGKEMADKDRKQHLSVGSLSSLSMTSY